MYTAKNTIHIPAIKASTPPEFTSLVVHLSTPSKPVVQVTAAAKLFYILFLSLRLWLHGIPASSNLQNK